MQALYAPSATHALQHSRVPTLRHRSGTGYCVICRMLRSTLLLILFLVAASSYAQPHPLHYIDTKTNASFRGLSVAADGAVWVSGSKGWIGRSTNGGGDWSFRQVPGYETSDFRTLYAFDSNTAIIANAGSPAYIFRTNDGGASWKKVYENNDSAAFIDGIDFWNKKRGLIHGDPIDGHMLLLRTRDGGKTWKARSKSPRMAPGEASFAASGTAIDCFAGGRALVAVGGKTSRLYYSRSRGRRWRSIPTPMLATSSSTGIFSVMTHPLTIYWLIAGGDYRQDTLRTANYFYTADKGKTWQAPQTTTRGYRECLAMIEEEHPVKANRTKTFAVGPSGIDISTDMGVNWQPLSDEKGFHVIKPSKNNKLLFLAGGNGKLAVMETTE